MDITKMTIQQLEEGILRCKDRLAWSNYGLMRTKERVLEAKKQYEYELAKRRQNELEFT